jgi:hypothetical protein
MIARRWWNIAAGETIDRGTIHAPAESHRRIGLPF